MDAHPENDPVPRIPLNTASYKYNDWNIVYHKSHILKSVCINNDQCKKDEPNCCDLCAYQFELDLPHLPDMVFAKNDLVLTHKNGAKIEFNPLDALRRVENGKSSIQVACADEWKGSRPGSNSLEEVKPFDWSFTTDYQGTFNDKIRSEETDAKLDIFKLMQKERLLFFQEVSLFEDELHDHGISMCSAKIRVMPSGFYILLTYFLRVDNVLIRMNGTRFHFEKDKNYILKEFTSKEAKFESIKHIPPAVYTVPAEIEKHLSVTAKKTEKLFFD